MIILMRGQRKPLSDFLSGTQVTVKVQTGLPGTAISLFGLNAQGKLADDRYMVFYNQPESPAGELRWSQQGEQTSFQIDLARLPPSITRLVLTATHDTQAVGRSQKLTVEFPGGAFDAREGLVNERAVMLADLYLHPPAPGGTWRVAAVSQGFDGGLRRLLEHFGGQVTEQAVPTPPKVAPQTARPAAAAPIAGQSSGPSTAGGKISLSKGQSVSLVKQGGAPLTKISLGLGWDPATGGGNIDLDASCIAYDGSGKVIDKVWFISQAAQGGAIKHSGDNLTGQGEGDDERIEVDLTALSPNVIHLLLTINSFLGHNFSQVRNAYCRVVDLTSNAELARYDLGEGGPHTGMFMARLSRTPSGWILTALGTPGKGATVRAMVKPGRDLLGLP
jgi:stress response protein SCP2